MAVSYDDDSRPAYVQVADAIRNEITGGQLGPGERLPSVRELSMRFEIATVTVQSALRVLRDEGYVASRSTRGYFVRDELPTADAVEPSSDFAVIRGQLDTLSRAMRDLDERVSHLEAAVRPKAAAPRSRQSERRSGD